MADRSVRYAPEFRRQMIELVRSGRTPASLAKEFGSDALDDFPMGPTGRAGGASSKGSSNS
jgi:hypothetical protein